MTTSRSKSGASLPEAAIPGSPVAQDAASWPHRLRWTAFLLAALIGLALRLPQLSARPMHIDEAVNAYIVGQLLRGESFTYDPRDRHGPALAALAVPLARIQGAKSFSDLTERELRLTSVVAGTATILLFGAAVEMFGFVPSLLAALIFAVAPLPVYYDRYFIHESLFCAATFALILSGWRALKTHSLVQSALAGACAALMFASKETAILHVLGIAGGLAVYRFWNLRNQRVASSLNLRSLLVSAGSFLVLSVVLFTWFGRNWKNLPAIFHLAPDLLARAAGQGHQKPFWYFAQLLTGGWSGALFVALACLGLVIVLRRRDASPFQWLAYYGLFLAIIYSLIPYKTPWLALSIWLPLALLAAEAVESLWRHVAKRLTIAAAVPAFCVLVAAAAVLIAHDTRQRVFISPAGETNPYAYAHTTDDILGLPSEIADFAHRNGIQSPRIAVIASDPWPLPWYLRHFDQVGYWQPGQRVPPADFYITSFLTADAAEPYADQLRNLRPDFFGVRPNVLVLLWLPAPK
jgi:uncharacterized protein (TIGR03663 family)